MGDEQHRRISLNLRVDPDKHAILENMRKTGFGLATTERNRSDVYNEVLGYGLQTTQLKNEIGERDFEKVWRMMHKMNWKKLNLEKIEKLIS